MKKSFKTFLIETEWNGQRKSFYNLYYWDYKPNGKVEKTEKTDSTHNEKDEKEYKELLTHFLQTVGSMNK